MGPMVHFKIKIQFCKVPGGGATFSRVEGLIGHPMDLIERDFPVPHPGSAHVHGDTQICTVHSVLFVCLI